MAAVQATVRCRRLPKNNIQAGVYGFAQHRQPNLRLNFQRRQRHRRPSTTLNPSTARSKRSSSKTNSRSTPWLTLIGGVRSTHFSGEHHGERHGPAVRRVAVAVPRLNWILRGFYGRFYQAPPLASIAGPLLEFARAARMSASFRCTASATKSTSSA